MSKGRKIAFVGWMALGGWFLFFESIAWLFERWTLSQQWWEWMQQMPAGLAWLLFAAYVGIGVHLWWPLFRGKK